MPAAPIGKYESLALALASGGTVRDWCREHKVAERTGYAWSGKAEVKARVAELRDAMVSQALGRLSDACVESVDALRQLLMSDDERIRLSAAKSILDATLSVKSVCELSQRVADLEANANAKPR